MGGLLQDVVFMYQTTVLSRTRATMRFYNKCYGVLEGGKSKQEYNGDILHLSKKMCRYASALHSGVYF
jgi:hypothetical protein